MKIGILAAGKGSRLKDIASYKPLVPVAGVPLLERTMAALSKAFANSGSKEDIVIIFNEDELQMDFSLLPSLQPENVRYFFKSTPSSMHSLYEVMKRAEVKPGQHLFVTMVDSIICPDDFRAYVETCEKLPAGHSSVLITSFVEDEKPLTVGLGKDGTVEAFQVVMETGVPVTSGVYCFSAEVWPHLADCVARGEMKMRNFLKSLVDHGHIITTFQVDKTLDVDRPEDIKAAEDFLGQGA